MLDKLFEAKQKAEEVKKRLDGLTVSGSAEGGKISVTANGNKVIQSISIDEEFLKSVDKEELEELLIIAANRALEQAENLHQSEMAALSRDMLGGMGGLGNLFGK
ncbi:MAG TPA: YbaB/EbfC family nucleoid-associated protein [Mucilaginibacter sp.]|nr:YbaB/EbfC family nucleoid-associated protein [Mucilaginibacter sp.]